MNYLKTDRNNLLLTFFLLFIVIGNNGLWFMPNIQLQFLVSQNLTTNPFSNPDAHCLISNYLLPSTFNILGGDNLYIYLAFSFFLILLFFIIFSNWFIKYHNLSKMNNHHKILAVIIFPIFMIPLYWIGMDSATLLLMLLIMINYNSKWAFLFTFLLGFQHFEQGLAGLLLLFGSLVIYYFFNRGEFYLQIIKKNILLILTIILSKAFLILFFYIIDMQLSGDRLTYLQNHGDKHLTQWIGSLGYTLFSLFGVGWFLILHKIRSTWALLPPTIVAFLFLITVEDQTRVGAMILFPSLFFWVFQNKEIFKNISTKFIIVTLSIYLIIPTVFVWQGYPFNSLLKYDLELLKDIKDNKLDKNFSKPFEKMREKRN